MQYSILDSFPTVTMKSRGSCWSANKKIMFYDINTPLEQDMKAYVMVMKAQFQAEQMRCSTTTLVDQAVQWVEIVRLVVVTTMKERIDAFLCFLFVD